ncbi:MAG TPA: ATP-binding protein [Leptospiraceae bacterium]|nr:ATP-binding protein [Leptospiraceae bacterium]HMW06063.1 ATP-binding protein [Leptospiraceae bacterium]HMY31395.1 ATP-binding protein [Leptospiraceae bacterium]HMZ64985.1 ATP-binding protein [Leptospiraceae bacterium]HNB97137.1 ATP-binding protein [Leptospiraceae bacterium]
MADELEIFKKSLEIVDSIPSLSIESIEKYLKEIDTHTDGGLKATILVIDDDKKIRDSLQTILEKKYNVILCENGQSGLQALTSSTFCVILDIKKSKDGFNTFFEIKKRFLNLPVIFYSSLQHIKTPYDLLNEYQPFAYVVKEGDNRALLDTIAVAVVYYLQINKNVLLIKQLQKMNQELEKSKKKYKDLVENSLDIIFSLDADGTIQSINKAASNILKYNVKRLPGRKFSDLIYKTSIQNQVSLNEKVFQENFHALIESRDQVAFNCDMVTDYGEPIEMHLKLKYIPSDDSFVIFGSAFNIEDDILLRLCETENQIYKIGNYLTQVDFICKRVSKACSKYLDHDIAGELRLCLKELLVNSVEHGNLGITFEEKSESLANDEYFQVLINRQKDPKNITKKVIVEYSLLADQVEFRITDMGDGFDHEKMLTRPRNDSTLSQVGHGRGIMMAREFFDKIEFNGKGNSVYLLKRFTR